MNMIERVARAIYSSFGEGSPDDWVEVDGNLQYYWEASIPQARAAIKAMREPTEAMQKAFDVGVYEWIAYLNDRNPMAPPRPFMDGVIDAALNEGEE